MSHHINDQWFENKYDELLEEGYSEDEAAKLAFEAAEEAKQDYIDFEANKYVEELQEGLRV